MTLNTNSTVLLKDFAEILPETFYWCDLNHHVLGFNKIGLKAIGASSIKDVIGKTPLEFYPKEMAEKIINNQKKVIESNKIIYNEELIEDIETGEFKTFDATIAPLYDNNRNVIGTCGISINITERKHLEEETIRQKNQLEKKLQFQRGYIKSFGYDAVNAFKTISDAIDNIEKRLMKLDVPVQARDDLNNDFYKINESLSEIYTVYQEINSTIIGGEDKIKNFDKKHQIPMHLENLVEAEMDIANGSISAEFDVEATFEMDETSKQKVNVDYKKLQHILRTLLANYTKAIDKDSRKEDIHLKITAKDGAHDKLYVTFNFTGNVPFLELEEDNIRAEHLMYKKQTHIAMDKHDFAYDLALAKHYADVLCDGEELNDYLFEGSRFSFALPFRKMGDDGKSLNFKPTIVE